MEEIENELRAIQEEMDEIYKNIDFNTTDFEGVGDVYSPNGPTKEQEDRLKELRDRQQNLQDIQRQINDIDRELDELYASIDYNTTDFEGVGDVYTPKGPTEEQQKRINELLAKKADLLKKAKENPITKGKSDQEKNDSAQKEIEAIDKELDEIYASIDYNTTDFEGVGDVYTPKGPTEEQQKRINELLARKSELLKQVGKQPDKPRQGGEGPQQGGGEGPQQGGGEGPQQGGGEGPQQGGGEGPQQGGGEGPQQGGGEGPQQGGGEGPQRGGGEGPQQGGGEGPQQGGGEGPQQGGGEEPQQGGDEPEEKKSISPIKKIEFKLKDGNLPPHYKITLEDGKTEEIPYNPSSNRSIRQMVRNHRRQLKAEGLSREDIADDVREYKKKLKEARAELKEKFGDLKGVDQGLISVIGLRDLQNGTHELGRYVNALTKGEQGQEIVYDTTGLRDLQGTERRDARTINRIARGAEQKGIAEHVKDPGFWDRLVENGRKQIPEQSHIVAEDPEQAREARRIANAQMILDVQPGSEVDRKKLINDFKREGYTEEEIRGLYKMAYEMAENDEQKQAVRAAAPKTFRESLVPPPGESQPKQEPKQNEGPAIKRGQGREDFGEQSGGKEPGEQ